MPKKQSLKLGELLHKEQETLLEVGKGILAWPELWQCTQKNRCFLLHQKLTSPKYSTKHFFSQVSQGNKAYVISMYSLCPAPPPSLESLGINGSREPPKTSVLTALTLGLVPLEASIAIWSASSTAGWLAGTLSAPGWAQHCGCMPGGSPVWPRATEAAQALPWTSMQENWGGGGERMDTTTCTADGKGGGGRGTDSRLVLINWSL